MILRLAGRAEGAEGPAVEAVEHRDDLVTARLAVEPGELDGRLVRLRAAVAEEALAAPAGALAERLGEFALGFRVPGVGHVDQLADLLPHRLDDARRTVAEQVAAPAGEEVEVAIALVVPDVRAFAAHQADRIARVVGDDVVLIQVNGGGVHVSSLVHSP